MTESDQKNENGQRDLRKGLILLAVGSWLLLNTLGIWGLRYGDSWPLLMILIGVALTIAPDSCGNRSPGPLLIGWGALCWIAMRGLWGFHWGSIWPLVLVLVGLSIVWSSLTAQRGRAQSEVGGGSNENPKQITKLSAEERTDER